MEHSNHKIIGFQKVSPFTLKIEFEDGARQVIDFKPVLRGEIYGPLSNSNVFDQVRLDEEVHTLVWPNGADFDPATLYDWTISGPKLEALTKSWTSKVG